MKENVFKMKNLNKGNCSIGCLSLIIILIGFTFFNYYMTTPQAFGDKKKVIDDIYRFNQRFGSLPKNLEELKSKLTDYQFQYKYSYTCNAQMFIVSFQGGGLMGDDNGEFYRSDTKEWKQIYSNRNELKELESRLLKPSKK